MLATAKAPARKVYIPPTIEKARQWVDQNWRKNPSLADVAAEAELSTFHFHRLFKRHTGQTLKNYIDDFRIAEAKRLLIKGADIAEVSALLRYTHQSHFTSRFRQRVGLPPSKWLKQQRQESAIRVA